METASPHLFGWRMDGGHRAIAATLPRFRNVAQGLMAQSRDDADVLLYKAFKDVLGDYPGYKAQEIGDCVSFGHAHGNDLLECLGFLVAGGDKRAFQFTDTEALYAMAREAGNMLGDEDGCYGSAAVKAMTEMGLVSRDMLGSDGDYSGRRAKEWGRTGAPRKVKDLAAKYKLGSAALVATIDEARAAMRNGYPVTICTGQGFTLKRDQDGFCTPKGTWGHCMLSCGLRYGRRPGALIFQSWGPDMPTGPTALDQPPNSFWIDLDAYERILAEKDSWAIGKAPSFVEQILPLGDWNHEIAA